MKILLDTCSLIWLCSDPDQLSEKASAVLRDENTDLYISDATILEVALKHSTGKLTLPEAPSRWFDTQCSLWRIESLAISHEDIFCCAALPAHHRDPFDRLIIAAARNRSIPVMTSDRIFSAYDLQVIW